MTMLSRARAIGATGSETRLRGTFAGWTVSGAPEGPVVATCGIAWIGDTPLCGHALSSYVRDAVIATAGGDPIAPLSRMLRSLNGKWALSVRWPDGRLIAAVDRVRSLPLFYGWGPDGQLILSDASDLLSDVADWSNLDTDAATEYLLSGYIMGTRTLRAGVLELQPGELLDWRDGVLRRDQYFRFVRRTPDAQPTEQLARRLTHTMDGVFGRLTDHLAGRQVIVPLSGGLDSRLVVAMLKRHGHRDLVALSYGRPGSRDVEISRAVAAALAIPWKFIAYEDGDWHELMAAPSAHDFWRYAGQAAVLPHVQDLLALSRLRAEDPELEAVFMPGYNGDMIAGSWTPTPAMFRRLGPEYWPRRLPDCRGPVDVAALTEWILLTKYDFWPRSRAESRLLASRIHAFFESAPLAELNDLAAAWDLYEFENRQTRYLTNAVRSFEFYGFDWHLPLCDNEFIDYFLTVPTALRDTKRLYACWMRDEVFSGPMTSLAVIPPAGPGFDAWNGDPAAPLRWVARSPLGALRSLLHSVEPPAIRRRRHDKIASVSPATDLRFHEWFVADNAAAQATRLESLWSGPVSPLSGLPRSVAWRLRRQADEQVRLVSPLGVLAAACLSDVGRLGDGA